MCLNHQIKKSNLYHNDPVFVCLFAYQNNTVKILGCSENTV